MPHVTDKHALVMHDLPQLECICFLFKMRISDSILSSAGAFVMFWFDYCKFDYYSRLGQYCVIYVFIYNK